MSRRSLGIVNVFLNGQRLNTQPGAKLTTGGYERTQVDGDQGIFFARKRVPWKIECTVIFTGDTQISDFNDAESITATFETDTGQRFVGNDGWSEKPVEMTGGNGGAMPVMLVFDADSMRAS